MVRDRSQHWPRTPVEWQIATSRCCRELLQRRRTRPMAVRSFASTLISSVNTHTLEIMMKSLTVLVGAIILGATSVAASAAPAEVTPDGLHRVDSSVLKL